MAARPKPSVIFATVARITHNSTTRLQRCNDTIVSVLENNPHLTADERASFKQDLKNCQAAMGALSKALQSLGTGAVSTKKAAKKAPAKKGAKKGAKKAAKKGAAA